MENELAIVPDDALAYWFDKEALRAGTDADLKGGSASTRREFAGALVAHAERRLSDVSPPRTGPIKEPARCGG